MKREYKGSIKRMNESRNYFRSLLNEEKAFDSKGPTGCKVDSDCGDDDKYSCHDGQCIIACKKGESDTECKARQKKALGEMYGTNSKKLNEQVTITAVNGCKCEEWNGTSCEGTVVGQSLKPYINNGNDAQVGDVFTGAGSTGQQEWVVVAITTYNGSSSGTHVNQLDSCGMTTPCDLATFTNLMGPGLGSVPQQFMAQLNNNWLPMFHGKYFNHPNGCKFLGKRLNINQTKLDGLIAAGTNPQWQAMLVGKIAAIQAVIDNCCDTPPLKEGRKEKKDIRVGGKTEKEALDMISKKMGGVRIPPNTDPQMLLNFCCFFNLSFCCKEDKWPWERK